MNEEKAQEGEKEGNQKPVSHGQAASYPFKMMLKQWRCRLSLSKDEVEM